MAFCGNDTGRMNPNGAAKVAASAGTNGFTPAATDRLGETGVGEQGSEDDLPCTKRRYGAGH